MWVVQLLCNITMASVYLYQLYISLIKTCDWAKSAWITPDTVTAGITSPRITSLVQDNRHWGKSHQIYWLHRTSTSQIKPNTASEASSQLTVTIHRVQRTSTGWLAAFLINLWPANSVSWPDGKKIMFLLFLSNPCVEVMWTEVARFMLNNKPNL